MGCCTSQPGKSGNNSEQKSKDAIKNFLEGGDTLDNLWKQFDENGDGHIDAKEFNNLVYYSLLHFCMQRNPDLPAPSRDNMEPFIKKLVKQLQPFVDRDQDMKITKEEFKGYGTYLTTEFGKLNAELEQGGAAKKDKKSRRIVETETKTTTVA